MPERCEYCKHCEEVVESAFNFPNIGMGMAIFGVPIPFPTFSSRDAKRCENIKSAYYGCKVDDYDNCAKFEEK